MAQDQTKKKQFVAADNPVETLANAGAVVLDEVTQPAKDIFNNALEQIGLKPQRKPLAGEINLTTGAQKTAEVSFDQQVAQLHAVQRQEKEVFNVEKRATQKQIQKLMQELQGEIKRLQAQTAELTHEVKNITVESLPTGAGIYHVNFFEWVIRTLKDLRQRVNESRQWLAASKNKKQQKGYWAMFKKHGTSFAMSEERAIASANG